MKILFFGDTQLDATPPCDRLDDKGRSVRFFENQQVLSRILYDAHGRGCEAVVHLGDLAERKNMSASEMEAAAVMFKTALSLGMKVYAVCGNHDGSFFEVSSSNFAALGIAFDKNFSVASKPTYWEDINVLALPYMHRASRAEIYAAVEGIAKPANFKKSGNPYKPILAMHYGATGAVVGPNNIAIASDALGVEDLPWDEFCLAFAGHYHGHQEVKVKGVDVCFPGSPYVNNFGERNDSKGYYIFDTKTLKREWIQSSEAHEWVQVSYPEAFSGLEKAPWPYGSIVKVVGTVPDKVSAEFDVRAMISKTSLNAPFFIKFELTEESQRVTRGDDFAELTVSQALDKLLAEKTNITASQAAAVKSLVMDNLRESSVPAFGQDVFLTSIEAKNFMTYDVLSYLFNREPVLLSGENGIGKTNFSEAVLFALTGEVSKPIPKDNLIRQGEKEAKVTLCLSNEEGQELIVNRTIKKTSKGTQQTLSVSFRALAGDCDEDWSDGGVREIQDRLNNLLGMSFNSLRAGNFLFQRDRDPLVFADPADRKKVLGDALNQAPLRKAADTLKKLSLEATALNAKLVQDLQVKEAFLKGMDEEGLLSEQTSLRSTLLVVSGARELKAKEVELAEFKVKEAETKLTAISKELEAVPNVSADLVKAQEELKGTTQTYNAVKEAKLTELNGLKSKKLALDGLAASLDKITADNKEAMETTAKALQEVTRITELQNQNRTKCGVIRSELLVLNKDLKKRESLEAGAQCSECGTPLTEEHAKSEIAKFHEAIDKKSVELGVLEDEAKRLGEVATEATKEYTRAQSWEKTTSQALTSQKTQLAELPAIEKAMETVIAAGLKNRKDYDAKVADLEAKIGVLKVSLTKNEEVRKALETSRSLAEAEKNDLYSKLIDLKGELRVFESDVTNATNRLAAVQVNLDKIGVVKKELEDLESKAGSVRADADLKVMAYDIMSAKGGLPVYLLDAQLPFLQSKANAYMAQLGMADLRISLDTLDGDKESLVVRVDNGSPNPLDIGAYSGGQLGRVEICLKQALADLISSSRGTRLQFLFYDEPTDGLDEQGKTALLEFLYRRSAERFASTMVVSHDPKLVHAFQRRLVVKKKPNGATTIETC